MDEHLRQLSRDPSLHTRADLIRARMRRGELSQRDVELLCYLGDTGARFALGRCTRCGAETPCPCRDPEGSTLRHEFTHWAMGFAGFGAHERAVRAAAERALFRCPPPGPRFGRNQELVAATVATTRDGLARWLPSLRLFVTTNPPEPWRTLASCLILVALGEEPDWWRWWRVVSGVVHERELREVIAREVIGG